MQQPSKTSLAALTLGAIGIVYGDIGTSPLYTVKEIFKTGLVPITPDNLLGLLSMLFWTLTTIVSVKYVVLVLRADNNGEGGLIAMLTLASRFMQHNPRLRHFMILVGIFGTCLFYGDGVITPAISVLSAVEGLGVVSSDLESWVIPLTLLILVALFWVQKRGTAGIGRYFGPVMVLWFGVLALLGLPHIANHPEILWAVNPWYAWMFAWHHPGVTFFLLGAIVLCVTGGEALYADMGHFGKRPIRIAWFSLAMPALTLNYFGQGALLLSDPKAAENPFFLMAPEWAKLPLVGLATAATVIASQALITGAFSATKQVIQLGYLPRLRVLHTNVQELGQIYMPFVNWGLFVLIVLAVGLFRNSDNLAAAYGIAVTTNMLITTTLTFFVTRYAWKLPLLVCIGATSLFFAVDFMFWASNMMKIVHGGWFPLLIAGVIFMLMVTWKSGRALMRQALQHDALHLSDFLESVFVAPPSRVDGTAVFLASDAGAVPNALLHNLKHNKVLHQQNLFVTVRNHEVPWIEADKRLEVTSLGHDCWQVIVNYGFKDDPNLPLALAQISSQGVDLNPMTTSYFLSRDIVIPTIGSGMAPWREKLFAQMHHNASGAAEFLNLPSNAVVELGSKIEI